MWLAPDPNFLEEPYFAGKLNGRGLASKRRTGSRQEDSGVIGASLLNSLFVIQPMILLQSAKQPPAAKRGN